RRPLHTSQGAAALGVLVKSVVGKAQPTNLLCDLLGRNRVGSAAGKNIHLRLAGLFKVPHLAEGLPYALTHNQRAMIAQNKHIVIGKIACYTLALVDVDSQSFRR